MKGLTPDYGERSLADLPGTIMKLLGMDTELSLLSEDVLDTGNNYDNVVLVLIDGLRYDRVEKTDEFFFNKAKENGSLEKITSVFPSATPVTLTTLNTGRMPLGHGLLGWEMYYEEFDDHIFTLPFTTKEGKNPEEEFGFSPEGLFEGGSVCETISDSGVDCYRLISTDVMDSEYTRLTSSEAEKIPYYNTADMALKLREVLENRDGSKYVYGYTADVDSVSHLEGPETEAVRNQVSKISNSLEKNLVQDLDVEVAEDTLVILTSDHGQIKVGEKVDLLQWDKVAECVKKDRKGDLIGPSGNAGRSVFLQVENGKVEELKSFLDEKIEAEVLKTGEAVEEGLFGEGIEAEKFRDRAGDLTIISHGRKIHWFRPDELEDKGFHGGLHRKEMEVPLLVFELADVQR